jgi:hypothetical protein
LEKKMATSLVNGLGGASGFGENFLARTDDGSTGLINLISIFGENGIKFYGNSFTGLYINNNGSVSFNSSLSTFTPLLVRANNSVPIIAPFLADADTRSGVVSATPGGNSTGSNLVWYDLDEASKTFTATWDDVGYFNRKVDKLNAFQLSIQQVNDNGDFDITFRYEDISWTTGDFSGGSNGLGGTPARIGFGAGNGIHFYEVPQSADGGALVNMENASNIGVPGTFVFNIRDGIPLAISIDDASIAEGNGPTPAYAAVAVNLSFASTSVVTVNYSTADGTAIAGEDYVSQSGQLTFAPGVTQQWINVELIGNTVIESHETFTVQLTDATGAPITDATGVGTILNDEVSLAIAATSANKAEGQSGSTEFTFTVTRTGDSAVAHTVNYAISGTAVRGADFAGGALPSGSVSFDPGETSKVLTINIAGDASFEMNEAFTVTLSSPSTGAVIGTATATGTIQNDDAPTPPSEGDDYLIGTINSDTIDGLGGDDLIQGRASSDVLAGGNGDDTLLGEAGNDGLFGGLGNDFLDGGADFDISAGGPGNDTYLLGNAGEVIVEWLGEGVDTIQATFSFVLPSYFENLVLIGSAGINGEGNVVNNVITGNGAGNSLFGNGGNDTLIGGGGADLMTGGIGSDLYVVDDTTDTVVELLDEGTDTIQNSVSYTLSSNVERMEMRGSAAINGTGNGLANTLIGNSGNNTLNGMEGNDTMTGGGGSDRFVFARGNIETVTDFAIGVDKIVVSAVDFGGGLISGGAVVLRAASTPLASGSGAQFLYDTDDGRLWFDVDGQGGVGPTYFARLHNAPSISAADFEVIA